MNARTETQHPVANPLGAVEPLSVPNATAQHWSAWSLLAILLAVGAVVAVVVAAGTELQTLQKFALGVALAWALCGAVIAWRRSSEPLGAIVAAIGLVAAVAVLADANSTPDTSGWLTLRAAMVAAIPALGLHLALSLPDGRLLTRLRHVYVVIGYIAIIPITMWGRDFDANLTAAIVIESLVLAVIGVAGYADRCRRAAPVQRARLQWAGWGVVVAGLIVGATWTLHELIQWPAEPGAVMLAATALVPIALALGSWEHLAVRIDRLLVSTIVCAGLVALVAVVYLLVVLGLGHTPSTDEERSLLGLSMLAAAIAAILAMPVRARLDEVAHRRVYGERRSPEEALQTFGTRMSRAVPMDELLLQLAESLKKSMQLSTAEVWTGGEGVVERAVSVPERGSQRLVLRGEELSVVAHARISGNAWLQVWLPALLEGRDDKLVRVAPVTHSGSLLGLIVVERAGDAIPFTDEEERALTELARQVALALHNVRLDSALQASLDELKLQAEELRASRSRIVAAADQSRRQIERNLHDGAQQHLVAMAVKLGLARQLVEADPTTVGGLLEELRGDAQETLTALRELAHGIYPPLLMDRGLPEALRAASNRAVLPTEVECSGVERYQQDIEAAVYFCCLEAMQNAGKHAGEGARMDVKVWEEDRVLRFEVHDTGAGFDTSTSAITGHGFVNMADRLGAIGGELIVESAPGQGTTIGGKIPLED